MHMETNLIVNEIIYWFAEKGGKMDGFRKMCLKSFLTRLSKNILN